MDFASGHSLKMKNMKRGKLFFFFFEEVKLQLVNQNKVKRGRESNKDEKENGTRENSFMFQKLVPLILSKIEKQKLELKFFLKRDL